MIVTGDTVEDFSAEDQHGRRVALSDTPQDRIVLFFYPRADTSGCTVEACAFRDALSEIKAAGAVVLGISRDTVKAQKKFADKFQLTYPLLADPDETICNRFGVIRPKNMYGRLVKGIERTTYLLAAATPDGGRKVVHVWNKVKHEGHAEAVLAWIKAHPDLESSAK